MKISFYVINMNNISLIKLRKITPVGVILIPVSFLILGFIANELIYMFVDVNTLYPGFNLSYKNNPYAHYLFCGTISMITIFVSVSIIYVIKDIFSFKKKQIEVIIVDIF